MDPFIKVPKSLLALGLSPVELAVMVYLLGHDLTRFSPSMRLMADSLNTCEETIRKTVKKLVAKNILTVTGKKPVNGTFINQYKINDL